MFKDDKYWARKIEEGVEMATMCLFGLAFMVMFALMA